MNRRRTTSRTLTGSRIYIRRGKYQFFAEEPMLNPRTGKVSKWHILCPEAEGELNARMALDKLLGYAPVPQGIGDFSAYFNKWRMFIMSQREINAPQDAARHAIWVKSTKALLSQYSIIEKAFSDFDVAQIRPYDIGQFLEQWEGQRSAQSYRAHMSGFFEWCAHRQGIIDVNPARQIRVTVPKKRDVYITDDQYNKIRDALLVGNDGKPTRTGAMVQCYMDLLYLLYQRGTDIRLLRWDQVTTDSIIFKPTKTERSSGTKVTVLIGVDARAVFTRVKTLGKMRSIYVIHTEHGQPYTSNGIGSLFKRACARAGIKGVTLKDLRAKAATDATKQGYEEKQLQTALAHTDGATTRGYIRSREIPVSEIVLKLPK